MTRKRSLGDPPPIMSKDTDKRLEALLRRFGKTPAKPRSRPSLTSWGPCEGQGDLFDEPPDGAES